MASKPKPRKQPPVLTLLKQLVKLAIKRGWDMDDLSQSLTIEWLDQGGG